ncbi:MAG: hypothetical protein ACE14S_05790 [Candidatus Bathyarchaeia archaeon]
MAKDKGAERALAVKLKAVAAESQEFQSLSKFRPPEPSKPFMVRNREFYAGEFLGNLPSPIAEVLRNALLNLAPGCFFLGN